MVRRRFGYLGENTLKKGIRLTDIALAEMDAIWDEGKNKGLSGQAVCSSVRPVVVTDRIRYRSPAFLGRV